MKTHIRVENNLHRFWVTLLHMLLYVVHTDILYIQGVNIRGLTELMYMYMHNTLLSLHVRKAKHSR